MNGRRIKYSCRDIIWGIQKGGGGKGGETLRTFKYSLNVKTILKKKSNRLIRHFASLVVLKKGSPIPYHLDTPLRKSNRLIRALRFARSYKKGFPTPCHLDTPLRWLFGRFPWKGMYLYNNFAKKPIKYRTKEF